MIVYVLLGISLAFGFLGFILSCLALNIIEKHRNEEHKEKDNEKEN